MHFMVISSSQLIAIQGHMLIQSRSLDPDLSNIIEFYNFQQMCIGLLDVMKSLKGSRISVPNG